MKESYFNQTIKKLTKIKKKIVTTEKIKDTIKNVMEEKYMDRKAYKMIYYLKNKGYLISIKKNLFYLKNPDDEIDEEEIAEQHYRDILRTHCKNYLSSDRYIGGLKSLELSNNDFSIPEEIEVINEYKQSREVIVLDKKVAFKKYSYKTKTIFSKLKKNTEKIRIGKYSFKIANLELGLLESLYSSNALYEKHTKDFIKKKIKKHKKTINIKKIEQIIKFGKHHSSINRLYKITQEIDKKLTQEIENIIKKHSFFINFE